MNILKRLRRVSRGSFVSVVQRLAYFTATQEGSMTTSTQRLFRHAAAAAALLAMTALAGCTSDGQRPDSTSVVPPPLPLAEAIEQAAASDEAALQEFRLIFPDAKVPEASRLRFVTREEMPYVRAECLEDGGFEVTVEDGGLGWVVYDETDQEKFYAAQYVCRIQFPLDPKFGPE